MEEARVRNPGWGCHYQCPWKEATDQPAVLRHKRVVLLAPRGAVSKLPLQKLWLCQLPGSRRFLVTGACRLLGHIWKGIKHFSDSNSRFDMFCFHVSDLYLSPSPAKESTQGGGGSSNSSLWPQYLQVCASHCCVFRPPLL